MIELLPNPQGAGITVIIFSFRSPKTILAVSFAKLICSSVAPPLDSKVSMKLFVTSVAIDSNP